MRRDVWLAVTVHDRAGRMVAGIEREADRLASVFSGIAVAGTDQTHEAVFSALAGCLPTVSARHPPGEDTIGAARREAVGLALEAGAAAVLYSDLDHLLRWIGADQTELEACLDAETGAEVLVVGRSPAAFEASPARLRETERLVNHVYELMTGRDWDLMFAIRRLSRGAGRAIVEHCREDTIANDVVWPLLAERLGFSVGYLAAEGLSYLTTADFDQDVDRRDHDPRGWIQRIAIAAGHAHAMTAFLSTD